MQRTEKIQNQLLAREKYSEAHELNFTMAGLPNYGFPERCFKASF
jgi:hypothetical protein